MLVTKISYYLLLQKILKLNKLISFFFSMKTEDLKEGETNKGFSTDEVILIIYLK